jgi:predicted permease
VLHDLRFSLRTLRRNPLVTGVAVLSLALGIGANTAIFSLLQQVVLRSLPVQDPERLVTLHSDYSPLGDSMSDTSGSTVFSYPLYRELRDQDRAFSGVIARTSTIVRFTWRNDTQAAHTEIVSGNFFQVLGGRAAVGRVLLHEDDGAPGANPVAVLGYTYWTTRLGGDRAILNQTVTLNGYPMVVVGVAAADFNGLVQGQTPDIFVPIAAQRAVMPDLDILSERNFRWLNLFARLAPSVTMTSAQAATDAVYHSLIAAELADMGPMRNDQERDRFLNHRAELLPAAQGISRLREKWQKPLAVLLGMVGLVLLIACSNIAGLLAARAAGRHREIAIRLAFGARRRDLVKQLLLEGLLLSLAGGVAALLTENWCTVGLLSLLPRDSTGSWIAPGFDPSLLAFTLVLAIAAGILFSLAPALQATRPFTGSGWNDRASTASGSATRLRRVLVTGQIALAMLLATGAGLFTLSLTNLLHINLGFRTQQLLSFSLNATLDRPEVSRTIAFYQDLLARLKSRPWAAGVAAAESGPFSGSGRGSNLTIEGYHPPRDESPDSSVVLVSTGFFRAIGIPLRAGREFDDHDTASAPKTVIVNESFAKLYFAGQSPVGRHMMFGASNHPVLDREVVGVVADFRTDVRSRPKATVYAPYTQWSRATRLVFYVRTRGDERKATAAILRIVHDADPNLPSPAVRSLDVVVRDSLYIERLIAILSGTFGILAVLLAAIGVYGVMAYGVARRTSEIGLRLALGAQPADVRHMILREAAHMVTIGLAIGLTAALLLGRLVESQLYGVQADNPVILLAAAATLAVVGLAAAFIPGWRASRIDPLVALRYE